MSVALDASREGSRGRVPGTTLRLTDRGPTATLVLDAVPGAVAGVRRWVCSHAAAAGADTDTIGVAELLTSEVVTNAVQHGEPGGLVTVTVARGEASLRVVVTDGGEGRPEAQHPGLDDFGGRGLQLVEALAGAWGVEEQAVGKSVWFEVPLAG